VLTVTALAVTSGTSPLCATLSVLFDVHPDEPMYAEVHAEDPGRPGKHQVHKRIPLCLMIGGIKYPTTIFAGATNDKTIVRSDKLVSKMRVDPLFLERTWPTAALDSTGDPHVLNDYMSLCDGGYHNYLETMSGMKTATNAMEARWTDRYTTSRLLRYVCVGHATLWHIQRHADANP
jgi:hypothetical protein